MCLKCVIKPKSKHFLCFLHVSDMQHNIKHQLYVLVGKGWSSVFCSRLKSCQKHIVSLDAVLQPHSEMQYLHLDFQSGWWYPCMLVYSDFSSAFLTPSPSTSCWFLIVTHFPYFYFFTTCIFHLLLQSLLCLSRAPSFPLLSALITLLPFLSPSLIISLLPKGVRELEHKFLLKHHRVERL